MAGRNEVEMTLISGKNLKNVNWKNGDLHPYAALWVDPAAKVTTKVAVDGGNSGEDPQWNEKITIPLPDGVAIREAVIFVDVVHANADKETKPLIGSARVDLSEIVDKVGIGGKQTRTLKLKRPSGRPHGTIEVEIAVKEPFRYYEAAPPPPLSAGHYAPPVYDQQARGHSGAPPPVYDQQERGYSVAPPPLYDQQARGYREAPPPFYDQQMRGYSGAPPPFGYGSYGTLYGAAPPSGYPSYGAPPSGYPPSGYPPSGYPAAPQGVYGQPYAGNAQQKKNKFGMGTGLAVGAAAGVLGGLALAEGADYVEDKITDDVAEKVEEELGYDDSGDF